MSAVQTGARRERVRAATITEIKQTALALMHEHGTTNVRFTDIAREMGMTPPALYRYFADRDELVGALIADGFDELGRVVAQARDAADPGDPMAQWLAGAEAYRQWAGREPQQFALILGLPVPGYTMPEQGPTTEAAMRAMGQLVALFVRAQQQGKLGPAMVGRVAPSMANCAVMTSQDFGVVIPPENFQAMLYAWASLHGFVSLEAYGHFSWIEPDARDALFVAQMTLAGQVAGLPSSRRS